MSTSNHRPKNRSNSKNRSNAKNRGSTSGKKSQARRNSGNRQSQRSHDQSYSKTSGGAPRKYKKKTTRRDDDNLDPIPGNREWGGLARKGVLRVHHDDQKKLENPPELETKEDLDPEDLERQEERKRRREERERRQEELQAEARAAISRAQKPASKSKGKTPTALKRKPITRGPVHLGDIEPRFRKSFGQDQGKKNIKAFYQAIKAYEEERFTDASRKLRPLLKGNHKIPEIYELYGLALYRKGDYQDAAESLEKFRHFASSTDQHPVLMDCYRARKRWNDIDYLWSELGEVSPSGPVVVEGRIVMAGALADRGDLEGAVKLLSKGWKPPKRPQEHHLRRAYALADLYDRAGNIARARETFRWVVDFAPNFVDAKDRLKNLN